MDNMRIYDAGRTVPQEAQKPIEAGRLKGKTDINPMWRIKRLTELFGPCGVGWWYEVNGREIVRDETTNSAAAFVHIRLFYMDPETGEASHGIPGTGGAAFVAQERGGAYLSDEAYKMALTDALSVACKALGIGADIYFAADRTKYTAAKKAAPAPAPEPAPGLTPKEAGKLTVPDGRKLLDVFKVGDGATLASLTEDERTDPLLLTGIEVLSKWMADKAKEDKR